MLANVGAFVAVSVLTRQSVAEQAQAARFVDVFRRGGDGSDVHAWKGTASLPDLAGAARALPRRRSARRPRWPSYAARRGFRSPADDAGGRRRSCSSRRPRSPARSAARRRGSWSPRRSRRTRCRSTRCGRCWTRPRRSSPTATSSSRSRRSSIAATAELRAANERLQELDRLKDDFVSTVTHELRTPLTSIRAFSEILHDNPGARRRRAAALPHHHHPGERAPDPAHQPGARPRQAGVRAAPNGRSREVDLKAVVEDSSTRRASCSAPRTSRSRCACRAACRRSAPTATGWCRC